MLARSNSTLGVTRKPAATGPDQAHYIWSSCAWEEGRLFGVEHDDLSGVAP